MKIMLLAQMAKRRNISIKHKVTTTTFSLMYALCRIELKSYIHYEIRVTQELYRVVTVYGTTLELE